MAAELDLFEPLTDDEISAVLQLKAAVSSLVEAHAPLRLFCNDWTYVRYLRARQWSLPKATKMLQATLQWRLDAKPHAIAWADVEAEAASGKNFVSLFPDRAGRPVVLMRPRNQNTGDEKLQVKFFVYCLEHASRLADAQRVGKQTWLCDFVGYSVRNAPSARTSLEVLQVLQNHYPERLGCAVCYAAPALFSLTWKAVCPFIDPVTKKKIDFVAQNKAAAAAGSGTSGGGTATTTGGGGLFARAFSAPSFAGALAAASGGGGGGTLDAHFALDTIEECMGGRHAGALFQLEQYRARMLAEDAEVAAAIARLEAAVGPSAAGAAGGPAAAAAAASPAGKAAAGGGARGAADAASVASSLSELTIYSKA